MDTFTSSENLSNEAIYEGKIPLYNFELFTAQVHTTHYLFATCDKGLQMEV